MESLAGKTEPVKFDELPALFDQVRSKLFPNFPIFDESHRIPLQNLIMGHYLTREICTTPWGRWQQMFNQKLMEIMPPMNLLYKSLDNQVSLYNDVNYTRTIKTEGSTIMKKGTTDKTTSSATNDVQSTTTNDGTFSPGTTQINTHTSTPQTDLDNFLNDRYLSEADKITAEGQDTSRTVSDIVTNGDTSGTSQLVRSGQDEDTEDRSVTETVIGKRGGLTYAELIARYKTEVFSVDQMIIDSLEECFFMIY